jgi:hypothetical protein
LLGPTRRSESAFGKRLLSSTRTASVCVIDASGKIVREGFAALDTRVIFRREGGGRRGVLLLCFRRYEDVPQGHVAGVDHVVLRVCWGIGYEAGFDEHWRMVGEAKLALPLKRYQHFLIHPAIVNADRLSRRKRNKARPERSGFGRPVKQEEIRLTTGIQGDRFDLGSRLNLAETQIAAHKQQCGARGGYR